MRHGHIAFASKQEFLTAARFDSRVDGSFGSSHHNSLTRSMAAIAFVRWPSVSCLVSLPPGFVTRTALKSSSPRNNSLSEIALSLFSAAISRSRGRARVALRKFVMTRRISSVSTFPFNQVSHDSCQNPSAPSRETCGTSSHDHASTRVHGRKYVCKKYSCGADASAASRLWHRTTMKLRHIGSCLPHQNPRSRQLGREDFSIEDLHCCRAPPRHLRCINRTH